MTSLAIFDLTQSSGVKMDGAGVFYVQFYAEGEPICRGVVCPDATSSAATAATARLLPSVLVHVCVQEPCMQGAMREGGGEQKGTPTSGRGRKAHFPIK